VKSGLASLFAPGAPPFRYVEQIRVWSEDGGIKDEKLVWIWVSPDRWREEISSGDFQEIRIGEPGSKIWRKMSAPSTPYGPIQQGFSLQETLRTDLPGFKIGKLRDRKVKGVLLECTQVSDLEDKIEVCFDGASHLVEQSSEHLGTSFGPTLETRYSNYRPFAGKMVPFTTQTYLAGKITRDREVMELTEEPHPDPSLFLPPAGAEELAGCAAPLPPVGVHLPNPPYPPGPKAQRVQGKVIAWMSIDVSGRVDKARIAVPLQPAFDQSTLNTIHQQWKFRPASCGGTPVPSEMYAEVYFRSAR
jgi:TonB family protein